MSPHAWSAFWNITGQIILLSIGGLWIVGIGWMERLRFRRSTSEIMSPEVERPLIAALQNRLSRNPKWTIWETICMDCLRSIGTQRIPYDPQHGRHARSHGICEACDSKRAAACAWEDVLGQVEREQAVRINLDDFGESRRKEAVGRVAVSTSRSSHVPPPHSRSCD